MASERCGTHPDDCGIALKLDLSFMDAPAPATAAGARPNSALARGVRITEVTGKINPEPAVADETEFLIEEFLSPRKLKALTGLDDLEEVHFLEMKVDTSETSLGNFGALLPNLSQLKLNNSIIMSIRDLGSSFSALRILWMARCGLQDVDGVSAMCSLKELYLAYNEVMDISPVSMLDQLDTLDLEGNNIDDIAQIEFLSLCTSLRCLTIEGNPVCMTPNPMQAAVGYDYRYAVKKAVPSLQVLDDIALMLPPAGYDGSSGGSSSAALAGIASTASFSADWDFLMELERDGTVIAPGSDSADHEPLLAGAASGSSMRPVTGYRPGTAMRPTSSMKRIGTAARTTTAGRLSTAALGGAVHRGSSPGIDGSAALDDASALTQGGVVCGNPSRALRTRHGRLPTATGADSSATVRMLSQFKHVKEHSYDDPQSASADDSADTLFNELKEWRAQHAELHRKIEASRAPQVLKIDYEEPILEDDDGDVLCDTCHRPVGDESCRCHATDESFLPEEADSGFRSRSEVTATPDDGDDLSSPASLTDSSAYPAITGSTVGTPPTPPEKPRMGGRRRTGTAAIEVKMAAPREAIALAGSSKDDVPNGVLRPNTGPAPASREKFRMEPGYDKSKPKFIDPENPIVRVELKSPEKPVLDRSSRTAKAAMQMVGPSRMRRQLPIAPSALPTKPALQK